MVGRTVLGMRLIRFAMFCGRDVGNHLEQVEQRTSARSCACTSSEQYQPLKQWAARDKAPAFEWGNMRRKRRFVSATRGLVQGAGRTIELANPELVWMLRAYRGGY